MTTLDITSRPVRAKNATMIVLAIKSGDGARVAAATGLDAELRSALDAALKTVAARGISDEIQKFAGLGGFAGQVVVPGSGLSNEPTDADAEAVRRAAGAAVRSLAGKATSADLLFPDSSPELIAATAEGAMLGNYQYNEYKTNKAAKKPLDTITVHAADAKTAAVKAISTRTAALIEQHAWARDLVNMPPLDLFPQSFADEVKKHFAGTAVKVEVIDDKALAKAGCGGLIGVGRGSARLPRLVKLTYKPSRPASTIALVGKGITFDSGGLCIKPTDGMRTMKCDMAGAASVAAAVAVIAELKLPVAVTAYLCLAENMVGADAQRPGDVVTMRNGKTVEIINTDAEGRLVMADGLSYASEATPDLILDVATLTGAAVVALGPRTSAVMSNSDEIRAEVLAAAQSAGEDFWPLPLLHEMKQDMASGVADIKHTGLREGGAITAALFLEEFVGNDKSGDAIPWAHLDIAAGAYNTERLEYGYTKWGATGHSVRTLVRLAEARAN